MAFPLDEMNEHGTPGYYYYLEKIVEGLKSEYDRARSRGNVELEEWIEWICIEYLMYEAQKNDHAFNPNDQRRFEALETLINRLGFLEKVGELQVALANSLKRATT